MTGKSITEIELLETSSEFMQDNKLERAQMNVNLSRVFKM
jgi:hypothetical protein